MQEREFEALGSNKVQKVDKATVLKELKIETINPFNGDVKGRTYMIMENPEKK